MEANLNVHSVNLQNRGDCRVRILEIIGNASIGGMENYLESFITNLPPGAFEVTCICPYESAFTNNLRKLGVTEVFITPIEDDPVWRSIQLAVEVARIHSIDIFHAHMPKAHVLAGLASCLVQKPVAATVHGMNVTAQEYGIARAVGSHLITNCQEAYTQALSLGFPKERLSIVRNSVDTDVFSPGECAGKIRKELGLSGDFPLIGFVGRLAWEKGPDVFLRVASHVHRFFPSAHFVIVGEGEMQEELLQMRSYLQLESYVHFVGWKKDTVAVYRELDILAHTSRSDGTSLVLLEAMACECPSVALAVGGIREIVEHKSTGFLAGAGDWEEVANQIVQLLTHPEKSSNLGTAARLRVERDFNVKTNTLCTGEILRSIASPPRVLGGNVSKKRALVGEIISKR